MTTVVNQVTNIFTFTQEVLETLQQDTTMQFPTLMAMLANKFSWDEKQVKDHDPLVRYYVRNHPDWCITRGARGGIMRASDKQKKQAGSASKEALKKAMREKIEAAAKLQNSNPPSPVEEEMDELDLESEDEFE